jgi:hypothetical protein
VRQRRALVAQTLNCAQPVETGHLNVEEHEVRIATLDQFENLKPVLAPSDDLYFRKTLEEKAEFVACEFLVVDHDGCDSSNRAMRHLKC